MLYLIQMMKLEFHSGLLMKMAMTSQREGEVCCFTMVGQFVTTISTTLQHLRSAKKWDMLVQSPGRVEIILVFRKT